MGMFPGVLDNLGTSALSKGLVGRDPLVGSTSLQPPALFRRFLHEPRTLTPPAQ
jgi:hypothetical protein